MGAPTVTGLHTQVSQVLVYCVGENERREAWLALISKRREDFLRWIIAVFLSQQRVVDTSVLLSTGAQL